jgi:hypothetical protein
MKVLIVSGDLEDNLIKSVFIAKIKRDYDIEILTLESSEEDFKDLNVLFIAGGKISKEVKSVVKKVINEGIDVYYVESTLDIKKIFITKFLWFRWITIDKYKYVMAGILPIKKKVKDLMF